MKTQEKISIFLVDDDPVYANVLKYDLSTDASHKISVFSSGAACLQNLNTNPDIIFLDYYLGGIINGIDVLKKINKFKKNTKVIIFLSGQESIEVAENVMKYGAYDYVVKNESAFIRVKGLIKIIQHFNELLIENKEFKKLALVALKTDNYVIITDENYNIEWVNKAFTRITGYNLNEVIGINPEIILQGELTDRETIKRIESKRRKKQSSYNEILNYHKNGSLIWLSLSTTPILDESENVVNYITIGNHITEKKKSEQELIKAYRIVNRTMNKAMSSLDELIKAKDDAGKISKVKDQFIANISHEIREQLNVITSMNYLLKNKNIIQEPDKK